MIALIQMQFQHLINSSLITIRMKTFEQKLCQLEAAMLEYGCLYVLHEYNSARR